MDQFYFSILSFDFLHPSQNTSREQKNNFNTEGDEVWRQRERQKYKSVDKEPKKVFFFQPSEFRDLKFEVVEELNATRMSSALKKCDASCCLI